VTPSVTMRNFLKVHPDDDMLVALISHSCGDTVQVNGQSLTLIEDIPAKHKVILRDVEAGDHLTMYGITVARANRQLRAGQLLTVNNVTHATDQPIKSDNVVSWQPPDVSRWQNRTFLGYPRDGHRAGTRNYWVVIPMVFCENRNLKVMREAMIKELGYAVGDGYQQFTRSLVQNYQNGSEAPQILETTFELPHDRQHQPRVFPHVDGVKFLTHEGGCGEAYSDSGNLCGLLAGYVVHPNVAGATVLSLGCQKAQLKDLEQQIHVRDPNFNKPLLIFEQQQMPSEQSLISEAIKQTFAGLIQADRLRREPVPLDQLVVGMECGGSDGFSGISANPAVGHCSDLVVALGGTVILSEFPELAGCENELAGRCATDKTAARFLQLMQDYEKRLVLEGNGFDSNPSPGNIRDGLITDAIKSAGAAKKGGRSPVVDVLDYPEPVRQPGLNLLCTPGGDVESTSAMAGSGANVMFFTTGLGTPTGNPVCPVLKISSNTELAEKLPDLIDGNAGEIVKGDKTITEIGEQFLELLIRTASGEHQTCAERLGQDDFIPWKRSLTF